MSTSTENNLECTELNSDDFRQIKLPDGKIIGPELGFTRLMVLLADSNSSYRAAALIAISELRGSKVGNIVIARLNDCATVVRMVACQQVSALNLRTAVPILYDCLNDRQPLVVCAAACTLLDFGDSCGYESVVKAVLKKGAHQMDALKSLNRFMEEKFPVNEKGLKAAIKMLSEPQRPGFFSIH
ncbi:MAG: HEAT repeat domain-containing protein [Sedimentisphaerales bacterium]|nr:HEAT repeat domain-containing protein [Sedimentisphaerales bacterium]